MKRHIHPLNNKNCTLWEAICDMENLKLAHQNAKKGKLMTITSKILKERQREQNG